MQPITNRNDIFYEEPALDEHEEAQSLSELNKLSLADKFLDSLSLFITKARIRFSRKYRIIYAIHFESGALQGYRTLKTDWLIIAHILRYQTNGDLSAFYTTEKGNIITLKDY